MPHRDSSVPLAASGQTSSVFLHRPAVCAYRDEPTCGLDGEPCRQPCKIVGLAVGIAFARPRSARTLILDALCNPLDYSTDREYHPFFEFQRNARRSAA